MNHWRIKRESYEKSIPKFSEQETKVLQYINMGYNDAWSISERTGMLITSVRRALNNLAQQRVIQECGYKYHEPTERNVTAFKIIKDVEREKGQQVLL